MCVRLFWKEYEYWKLIKKFSICNYRRKQFKKIDYFDENFSDTESEDEVIGKENGGDASRAKKLGTKIVMLI